MGASVVQSEAETQSTPFSSNANGEGKMKVPTSRSIQALLICVQFPEVWRVLNFLMLFPNNLKKKSMTVFKKHGFELKIWKCIKGRLFSMFA